jgi:hypothetical protein
MTYDNGYIPSKNRTAILAYYDEHIGTEYECEDDDEGYFTMWIECETLQDIKLFEEGFKKFGGINYNDWDEFQKILPKEFDDKDDYCNAFYIDGAEEYEIVIRKFNDSFSAYVEICSTGELTIEKDYDTYSELVKEIEPICINYKLVIPSEEKLKELMEEYPSNFEEFEICTECHDPDCIEETGGCNR